MESFIICQWMVQESSGQFYTLFFEERTKADASLPEPLNVGSCNLHIVHGAFYTDAYSTRWKLDGILRTLWHLFHNTPLREKFMQP